MVILFNPTIPQSVPRSNNLTSSPDKRGFPTRNAASPLSSYLSCLLSHHIKSHHQKHKNNTDKHNITTQHSTHLLSLVIFPAFTSRCTQQHTTTTTTTLTNKTTTTTTHKNSTDNQNQNNTGNHNITKNFTRTKLLPRMKSFL